jgi:hypothetical protein
LSNSTIFEQVVDQVSLLGRRDLAQPLISAVTLA